ncbi:MAG: class IV aminotransferase [Acidobacteria bacterium]|nr:class IV aminotransferase [Acidobacteriota bacterium]
MHPHLLYNDDILPTTQAILRPGQLGLLAGWGVFTTLRIYEGVPFEFEKHWARIQRDAAKINVPLDRFERDAVRERLIALVERDNAFEASLRLCIVRSQGGLWEGPGSGNAADLVAFAIPVKGFKERVALSVTEQGRHAASPFAGTKTLSWSHNLTMAENAARAGFDETILLNERGEVAECTSANIFAVLDGQAYTPPLSSGPLPGVTREVMLNELSTNGSALIERVLTMDDLYRAEEVFITSSTRELIPVERIGDRKLTAESWPVMTKILAALRVYIRSYVEARRRVTAG